MHYRIIIAACVFSLAAQPLSAVALSGSSASSAAPAATSPKPHITSPLRPIKRVAPKPPSTALTEGFSGNVMVCFTVKADGSVSDARVKTIHPVPTPFKFLPSPKIQKKFGKSALDAIRKWKFSPRMVNGKAVATPNVCQSFIFNSPAGGAVPFLPTGGGPIH